MSPADGEAQIPFEREVDLAVSYKGSHLNCAYRADFVCYERVIVELKALRSLSTIEESQLLNYLKATRLDRGLLLSCGAPRLEYKRMVREWRRSDAPQSKHLRASASSADRRGDQ